MLRRVAAFGLRCFERRSYALRVRIFDGIYSRVLFPFFGALLAAITLAWWIATSLIANTLEQRLVDQLTHASAVITEGTIPITDDVLTRMAQLLNAGVVLITPEGHPDLATPTARSEPIREAVEREWPHARDHANHAVRVDGETPLLLVFRPMSTERGEPYAGVAAVASLTDVEALARRAAWWLGVVALVETALLGWIGHRVTRSITGPISRLATMAKRIAAGDRSVRAALAGPNEVVVLANTVNGMIERIDSFERELADRNRLAALGEMAARVAHEIRNPLTAIKLQIQLLGESLDNSPQRATVARLLNEVRRLELIVSGVLAAGRPIVLDPRATDLNQLIGDVAALMEPQLGHRGIELQLQLGPVPQLPVDADRIKQVLFNLLTNAMDELAQGGTIRVSTEAESGCAILRVEDSGRGVAPEVRETLFRRVANGKPAGLGVGLLLSKEIIELHQGRIEVDASPTLGGARFSVRLPSGTASRLQRVDRQRGHGGEILVERLE